MRTLICGIFKIEYTDEDFTIWRSRKLLYKGFLGNGTWINYIRADRKDKKIMDELTKCVSKPSLKHVELQLKKSNCA